MNSSLKRIADWQGSASPDDVFDFCDKLSIQRKSSDEHHTSGQADHQDRLSRVWENAQADRYVAETNGLRDRWKKSM